MINGTLIGSGSVSSTLMAQLVASSAPHTKRDGLSVKTAQRDPPSTIASCALTPGPKSGVAPPSGLLHELLMRTG